MDREAAHLTAVTFTLTALIAECAGRADNPIQFIRDLSTRTVLMVDHHVTENVTGHSDYDAEVLKATYNNSIDLLLEEARKQMP